MADPTAGCESQVKVLVVGDSTGRGASNGLVAAGDPRVVVWDRTVFGCSLGNEDCPDWRVAWAEAVAQIDPDVVVLFANVPTDLRGIDDAPFMSDEAFAVRVGQLADVAAVLSTGGARVLFTTPAAPLLPNGLFFCDGKARNTSCDPAWVARWNESVRAAAAASGAGVADVGAWLAERGSTEADRPEGAHLAGPTLVEHAKWLIPQILAAAGR